MQKYKDKIAKVEQKIEQERQRLRDLRARETAQKRKDDTRKKILYGAAILSLIESLPDEKRRQTFDRVHRHVRNAKDREFLGLPTLPAPQNSPRQNTAPGGSKASSAGLSETPSSHHGRSVRRDPTG